MTKEKRIWCVYIHTNKINGKRYVGISSDIKSRWRSEGSQYYDQVVGDAFKKYGWDNFKHEIIYDDLTKEEACRYEQELIEKYNTMSKDFGYNRSKGGDSGSFGAYDTQLNRMVHVFQYDYEGNFIKMHISVAAAVRDLKPGYTGHNSYNIPTCCKGKRLSALGYRWFYEYQGEKIEPILPPEERTRNGRMKQIFQYTLDGRFVTSYKSIEEAKALYNANNIDACVAGKIQTSAGYQWFDEFKGDIIAPVKINIKNNAKKVNQYDLNHNYIATYNSITEAAIAVGQQRCNITACCRGRYKTIGGYIWDYALPDCIKLNKNIR